MLEIISFIIKNSRPKDWSIRMTELFMLNGMVHKVITFLYNGKKYKYIGENLVQSIPKGFFMPITDALWNTKNVTEYVKMYAGPRHDFFGTREPNTDIMFHETKRIIWKPVPKIETTHGGIRFGLEFQKIKVIDPIKGLLTVTNVIGQQSVFGAR
jgi:hypothetical protein